MNKNTVQLIKEYITNTLQDPSGISEQAYKSLNLLMQEDRDIAFELHDVISRVNLNGSRYSLLNEMILNEVYEL